jgi:hypothetical protein
LKLFFYPPEGGAKSLRALYRIIMKIATGFRPVVNIVPYSAS